jgi:hypothetical protein
VASALEMSGDDPAAVRKFLNLTQGSVLVWTEEEGRISVQRAVRHSTAEVHEVLFAPNPPAGAPVKTLPDLKQGIRQHMQRKHAGR